MKRETRIKRIAEKREERILFAALEAFSQKGFAAATVAEIAEAEEGPLDSMPLDNPASALIGIVLYGLSGRVLEGRKGATR